MTVKTTVDLVLGAVIQEASGPMTLAAAKAAFDDALKAPGFQKDMPVIWDLRQADLTAGGSFQNIQSMVEHMRANVTERGQGYRVAFVVGREVDFGLARKFEAIAADLPHRFLVCRDMEEARRWVGGAGQGG